MEAFYKVLLSFVLLLGKVIMCSSQEFTCPVIPQQAYVETVPNANLYELKGVGSYTFPLPQRTSYDVSGLKNKKVKKPTRYEVVDITNIHKVKEYDAYVVKLKEKYYLISESDVEDNTILNTNNTNLMRFHQVLKDSVDRYSPYAAYNKLMDLVRARIKSCSDSSDYLVRNYKEIYKDKARKEALAKVGERVQKYRERRENYYNWVSTLPKSVQKDANVFAIPESYLDVGYVGNCGYRMRFINMTKKTIKYLTWSGRVKNAVGDYISCDVRHTSSFSGKYTGPCNSLCDEFAAWDAVLYNNSAEEMVLTSVKIIYTDGSSVTIGKLSLDYLTNIPKEVFLVNGYSFFGYLMGTSDEEGFDLDVETENTLFLSRNRYESELRKERIRLSELERNYQTVKQIVQDNRDKPSILGAHEGGNKAFIALRQDKDLFQSLDNYRYIWAKHDEISKSLEGFEIKFFGFLK